MLSVLSPVSGTAVGLSEIPDPVFAQGMVGPGTAIRPRDGLQEAVAPVTGKVAKLHAHAFVLLGEGGRGVLVHLGIDTVKLDGAGFDKLVEEGAEIEAGRPMIRWNPADVTARGLSPIVPIVALDADGDVISRAGTGEIEQGDLLFQWA
ncbi:glucose-specific phosphotransferase system IIA component [Spinactinospora alkalitolerans]|uniref:Glucose-specific phosphotransferase system IIA component n=1 Tax=Spinactinospora alkalitolerans TaxID=687207 RepID=A0A852U3Z2_9ACTN|nr:PTS glucose transporter subunit IIA [Spinactinospora alkalitolerans]NYE49633.1 glucose-specific phosphotransferase system IIA component [Spinactinospora alkalitolerans]